MNEAPRRADDLALSPEEAHLLRSPANAKRLFSALARALANEGLAVSTDDLRREVDLGDDERRGSVDGQPGSCT